MNIAIRALAIVIFGFGFVSTTLADPAHQTFCGNSMIKGTYGIQMQGTNIAPNGQIQTLTGVVIRVYDGDGGVVQWDNIKGSITGMVPNRYGSGSYQVNDDCTVDIIFQPAPGVTLQERAVVVDNGKELRSIVALPAATMVTATHIRI